MLNRTACKETTEMNAITYPYGFVPNLPTMVKWDNLEQLIPRPDLTDIESKIMKRMSDEDIHFKEINEMLKRIPLGYAYIDWDKIQLSALSIEVPQNYEAGRLYLQFPVASFCVSSGSPITKEEQRELIDFLFSIGYRKRGLNFMGEEKNKKEYFFYEVDANYKDDQMLSKLFGSFANKFSIWSHIIA